MQECPTACDKQIDEECGATCRSNRTAPDCTQTFLNSCIKRHAKCLCECGKLSPPDDSRHVARESNNTFTPPSLEGDEKFNNCSVDAVSTMERCRRECAPGDKHCNNSCDGAYIDKQCVCVSAAKGAAKAGVALLVLAAAAHWLTETSRMM